MPMHMADHKVSGMDIPSGQCPFMSPVEIGHTAHIHMHNASGATTIAGIISKYEDIL